MRARGIWRWLEALAAMVLESAVSAGGALAAAVSLRVLCESEARGFLPHLRCVRCQTGLAWISRLMRGAVLAMLALTGSAGAAQAASPAWLPAQTIEQRQNSIDGLSCPSATTCLAA